MKFNVGEIYYLKGDFRDFQDNECVQIIERVKYRKDTIVRVKDINNKEYNYFLSTKQLRKRSR